MGTKKISRNRRQLSLELRQVKVVYTDLDKTLLGPRGSILLNAAEELTLRPITGLAALLRAGIDVVFVSGRTVNQLREITRLLALRNFIAEMGGQVYYGNGRGKVIAAYRYQHQSNESLYEAITKSGAPAALLRQYKNRLEYHLPWAGGRSCSHLFRGHVEVKAANEFLAARGFKNLKLIDNGLVNTKGSLQNISEVHAYHLLPLEVSKAAAVKFDCRRRGFKREETIAVGDSAADIGMAAAVGWFFLVGDELKDHHLKQAAVSGDNIYMSQEKMGLGWAEVASLLADI